MTAEDSQACTLTRNLFIASAKAYTMKKGIMARVTNRYFRILMEYKMQEVEVGEEGRMIAQKKPAVSHGLDDSMASMARKGTSI